MSNPGSRRVSFFFCLAVLIIAVAVVSVAVLAGYSCLDSRDRLLALEARNRSHAGSSLVANHWQVDNDLSIFDGLNNDRMQQAFPRLIAAYERAGRDPFEMDLASLRQGPGDGFDLFVIDGRGRIITTTDPDEPGFGLTTYPGVAETRTAMRLGDGFAPDRVVQEKGNGVHRKYGYHPTPDHRHLLEIGLRDSAFATSRKQLSTTDLDRADAAPAPVAPEHDRLQRARTAAPGTGWNRAAGPGGALPCHRRPVHGRAARSSQRHALALHLHRPVEPGIRPGSEPRARDRRYDWAAPGRYDSPRASVPGDRHPGDSPGRALRVPVPRPSSAVPCAAWSRTSSGIADGEPDHPLSAEPGALRRAIDRVTARLKEQLSAFQASVQHVREQNEALEVRVEERTRALAKGTRRPASPWAS